MTAQQKGVKPKICMVVPGSIFTTPYLTRYMSILKDMGINYDLILWRNKDLHESSSASQEFVYNFNIRSTSGKLKKLWGYFGFFLFARGVLKKKNYDKVFALTGNTAVLLHKILVKKYRGRYLVDIRDYFMENNKYYYNIEKKVIENSGMVVISSKGYKNFLPEHKYIVAHNYTPVEVKIDTSFRQTSRRIVLSYIGNMRFFEQDKKLLSLFCNDARFWICLNGKGYGQLQGFCTQIGMENVSIVDFFKPEDTVQFYKQTDIVLNLYGNHTPLLDYALSNKLYYAAQYHKPILVCKDTYMSELSCKYKFGFEFDLDNPKAKDTLYDWYVNLNWDLLDNGCEDFIKEVIREDKIFENELIKFIKND